MLEQLWHVIQVMSAGIITLGGAAGIFVGLYRWAKKPDIDRDEKLKGHDEMLDNDNKRLNNLEKKQSETDEALQIMMKSMLALMSNAIDGNHKEELKLARDDMQNYLIRR